MKIEFEIQNDFYFIKRCIVHRNFKKLKQSLFRHVIEVMNGNYQDEEREYGHLEALVCNAMFINYQLKK